jgi:thioredoxin 1
VLKEINGAEEYQAEVMECRLPVLVDFWGPRCKPCLALMPHVETLAGRWEGRLRVVKFNCAQAANARLCVDLGVMSLPTFILYRDGREVARLTGAGVTPAALEELAASVD